MDSFEGVVDCDETNGADVSLIPASEYDVALYNTQRGPWNV